MYGFVCHGLNGKWPTKPTTSWGNRCGRVRSVRSYEPPKAQFNYNIYQDGAERSKRSIGSGERAVTLTKPLGLVLEETSDGMVFISRVDASGSAAQFPEEIQEGDVIVAISATFGDEVWSTRGIGLERVMKAVQVRSGDLITLVLETPTQLEGRMSAARNLASSRKDDARDKFGEREVLDPLSWTSTTKPQFDDQYPVGQNSIDSDLKEKLKAEVVAPYEQNWILWISIGVGILSIVLILVLGG